jgi:hypothetical protein
MGMNCRGVNGGEKPSIDGDEVFTAGFSPD